MKNILFLVFYMFFLVGAKGQNRVSLQITGFENNKGNCKACIFKSNEDFEKMNPFQCVTSGIKDQKSLVSFENIHDGTYAVFVFHDKNNNQVMDKNFLGIPKEGYGASKNKLPFTAAPRFSDNKFSLKDGALLHLDIRLRNL